MGLSKFLEPLYDDFFAKTLPKKPSLGNPRDVTGFWPLFNLWLKTPQGSQIGLPEVKIHFKKSSQICPYRSIEFLAEKRRFSNNFSSGKSKSKKCSPISQLLKKTPFKRSAYKAKIFRKI